MVYAIAQLKVTDKEALGRYREQAGAALAKHGGAVVSGGANPEMLEGDGTAPDIVALLSFPSVAAARAWRNDPELAQVHALRNAGGASSIFIVPGN